MVRTKKVVEKVVPEQGVDEWMRGLCSTHATRELQQLVSLPPSFTAGTPVLWVRDHRSSAATKHTRPLSLAKAAVNCCLALSPSNLIHSSQRDGPGSREREAGT